ncbi:MAG TPA: hypothetical protein VMF31_14160 [Solirubrobacterales bacterium]|nr:hypothetical protein [Solirubrobacterales bacterium]
MSRPVRDERWVDAEGELWQVESVAVVRATTSAPRRLAFVRFRRLDGQTMKVSLAGLRGWRRHSPDPFLGRRRSTGDEVREGAKVIVFPAPGKNPVCPVLKGEIYHLAGERILVDTVTRKVIKGRDAEWHIGFIRLQRDRVLLLRQTVPGPRQNETVKEPTAEEVERARIDGNYTSSRHQSDGGTDAGEAVPTDWVDKGAEARRDLAREHRAEIRGKEDQLRQKRAAKAKIDETYASLSPDGKARLLERIKAECDAVKSEEVA